MPKNDRPNLKGKRILTSNQTEQEQTDQDPEFLPPTAKKTKLNTFTSDDEEEHYFYTRTDEYEEVDMDAEEEDEQPLVAERSNQAYRSYDEDDEENAPYDEYGGYSEDEAAIRLDQGQTLGYATEEDESIEYDEDFESQFDLEQSYEEYETGGEEEDEYQAEYNSEEDLLETKQIQFNSPKEAKDKLNEIIQLLKSNPALRVAVNDNPYLIQYLEGNDIIHFTEKLFKKNNFDNNEYEIIQEIDFHVKILQNGFSSNTNTQDIGTALRNEFLTQQEIIAKFQKIIYLLENNSTLQHDLSIKFNVTNILFKMNIILSDFSPVPPKIDFIKNLANKLEDAIEKISAGKHIDMLLAELQTRKKHQHQVTHFEGKEQEIERAYQAFPISEVERRKLLHENIQHENTSRFQVLDEVATILRKYRDAIKEVLGADARIKFRGSLVRGLKGYPKSGVAPTLDSYDCDAFIEVPDEWWSKLKKLRPGASIDEDGKVRIKPLRDYESLSSVELGVPGAKPQAILAERVEDEKQMQLKLDKLIAIEAAIKSDLAEAKHSGKLAGYAENENGIDFDFYLRPVSAVKKTYSEGNPYTPEMIMDRGFAAYASAHETQEIPEFRANVTGQFKRAILPVTLERKDDGYRAEGIILEEYQVVIGRRGWYIEDQYLFEWRKNMHTARATRDKIHASRQELPIYQEPLAPIQRDYKDQVYKDSPSDRGNTLSEQGEVNTSYKLFYKRELLFWQGPKKSFAKDHPVMQLGAAKEIIGCVYNNVETFSVNKVKELTVLQRNILKDFFEGGPKDLVESTQAFLKNERHPLYVQELITTLEKTREIPTQEKRVNFFEDIIKTLKENKENQPNYDFNKILVTQAEQYKQSSEQDIQPQMQRAFNPDGLKGV